MTNVSWIVFLGSSIYCILRRLEALGRPDSDGVITAFRFRVGPLLNPSRVFGGLESLEAGSDECLEDPGPGRLHLPYFTRSGGSWEVQILTSLSGVVGPGGSPLKPFARLRRFGESGGWK